MQKLRTVIVLVTSLDDDRPHRVEVPELVFAHRFKKLYIGSERLGVEVPADFVELVFDAEGFWIMCETSTQSAAYADSLRAAVVERSRRQALFKEDDDED